MLILEELNPFWLTFERTSVNHRRRASRGEQELTETATMTKKIDEICEKVKFIQKYGSEEEDSCLVEMVQELYRNVIASRRKLTVKEGNIIRLQKPIDLDDPNLYKNPATENRRIAKSRATPIYRDGAS